MCVTYLWVTQFQKYWSNISHIDAFAMLVAHYYSKWRQGFQKIICPGLYVLVRIDMVCGGGKLQYLGFRKYSVVKVGICEVYRHERMQHYSFILNTFMVCSLCRFSGSTHFRRIHKQDCTYIIVGILCFLT